jgi:succinyl-diaminopimelate desuccinylase
MTSASWQREILDLAVALVRTPTANPPGDELRAAEIVARLMADTTAVVRIQPVGDGRGNLVVRVRGAGGRPTLVFCGHLDTVPIGPDAWSVPPLGGEVRGGRLFGRGSADMKGAIAAMAVVVRDLARSSVAPQGDVVLALTAGEEVDSCGARQLVEAGLIDDAGMLVIGEMTGLDVGCAHKGLLWLNVETTGRRGHGSIVGADANAVAGLVRWLSQRDPLDRFVSGEHPVLGRGSVSVNQIVGGDAPNVVPAHARAVLDVRTLPDHDHEVVLSELRGENRSAAISVLREGRPVSTEPDHWLVTAAVDAATEVLNRPPAVRGLPYLTDASVLVEGQRLPTVVLGPGEEAQAHGVDESVAVDALVNAARIYRGIADRLLMTEGV